MSEDYRIETKSDGKTYVTDVRREEADRVKAQEQSDKMNNAIWAFLWKALKFLLWDIAYISAFILSLFSLNGFVSPGIWAKLLGIAGCAGLILIPYSFKKYKDWLRPIGLTVCLVQFFLMNLAGNDLREQQQAERVVYQAKQEEDRRISQAHEQAKQEENRRISEAQEQAKLLADRKAQKEANEIREAKLLADRKAQKEANEIREALKQAEEIARIKAIGAARKAQQEVYDIEKAEREAKRRQFEVKRLAEQEERNRQNEAKRQSQNKAWQEELNQRAATKQSEYKAREAIRQSENKARQEELNQRAAIKKAEAESLHRR